MTQLSLYEANNISLRPLRPKQATAIAKVRQAIREGHKRIILQAPTGFGKTLTAAHIIASALERRRRPLFTCPAITLVDQTLRAFEAEGIRSVGVIQAQHERTDWTQPVQIASVQTLVRRALPEVHFILIDEVHEQFEELNKRLDSDAWKDKIVIGLSATPWARGMGLRYTKLIVASTIQELIDDGHLSPFQIYVPNHNLDRSKIKVVKGEFQEKSASDAMSDKAIIGDVVETWKEKGPGEKTFLFCVNRAHAREQMNAFTDSGIPFGYIDAFTPLEDRRQEFARMRHGEIAGVASVGCLIRGVDEDVRCIIDAQPTQSEMRHVQKWGRGLRTAEGKDYLVGLDHAGNTLALGMVTDIQHDELDTRKPGEKDRDEPEPKPAPKPKKCEKCNALIPPGRNICPQCGEKLKLISGVEAREGELVLYGTRTPKPSKSEPKPKRDEKQDFYSGLLGLAAERGHKEGWAYHRYMERFGVGPEGLKKVASFPSRQVRMFDLQKRREWRKQKEGVA
jgi:DNA repair protein RadD